MIDFLKDLNITNVYEGVFSICKIHRSRISSAFIYTISGETTYEFQDGTGKIVFKKGDVLFVPENAAYTIYNNFPGVSKFIVVNFHANIALETPKLYHYSNIANGNTDFSRLARAWTFRETKNNYECLSIFYRIVANLSSLETCYVNPEARRSIKDSVEHLEKHIFDPELTVKELAKISNISEPYFRRLFTKIYGTSPKKYIFNKRISAAADIITGGDYDSLAAVAESVGFSDPLYFSKAFKAVIGENPSKYHSFNNKQ